MFPSLLGEVWVLLMWVFSFGVPGAKAANPYNEINQKAPLFPALVLPALIQAVWNSVLYQDVLMTS